SSTDCWRSARRGSPTSSPPRRNRSAIAGSGNDAMRTIDLHGLTSKDAIARFVDVYNHAVRHGRRERISVVHGYGASGKGGTLREKMRAFLDRSGVEYLT